MKKIFFAIALLVICCIQVNAQSIEEKQSTESQQPIEDTQSIEVQQPIVSSRYHGFIEISLLPSHARQGIDNLGYAVNTTHGLQVTPHLFIGGGIGVYVYSPITGETDLPPSIALPLYGDIRVNILNGKISPFIDVKAGYSHLNNIEGVFFSPTFGARFAPKSGPAINVHIGYTLQGDRYVSKTDYIHSMTLGIGVDF